MPVDLQSHEFQLLLRQFERGNVILFAGAGFSIGARNRRGEDPPLGSDLAKVLAEYCGWEYGDESLPAVYEQARTHLGNIGLYQLLGELYKECTPAEWHLLVPQLFWYRIYTTNIDDVIQNSYQTGTSAQYIDTIVQPAPSLEQDQFYERVQCVHLHGSILDPSKPLTFTLQDLAEQTAMPNPWYQTLVEDMLSKTVIFIGTKLGEPPFYHYLQLRTHRGGGTPESRAKAFLVNPNITPIYRRQFQDQNFVVIDASGEEFFRALVPAVQAKVPSRVDLLGNKNPHQIAAIRAGAFDIQAEVLRQFDFVTGDTIPPVIRGRIIFFEGAEPSWDDIRRGVDAWRDIAADFLQLLKEDGEKIRVVALTGQAGSGKSTMMKRLAFELARDGRTVYFSRTSQKLNQEAIVDLAKSLGDKHTYIFLDDARDHVSSVRELVGELPTDSKITFVFADRAHALLPELRNASELKATMIEMPQLVKSDCERIIDKLEEFGFPGALRGMSRDHQLREFLGRSKKQLLVAMKEATSGHGFDAIIEHEYNTLASDNARTAYAIACLAYMHAAPVRRRHLVACLDGTDVEKANTLERDLQGVVISWRGGDELMSPRHRIIADRVATGAATFEVRQEAIKRFLIQLSPELSAQNIQRRTPEFTAYRGIINFDNMQRLFGDDQDVTEDIYDELAAYYGDDYLFWLQYGRAEVYFNNFSVAENYLKQSLGIRDKGNFQAKHYLGVLCLKRSQFQPNAALAASDAEQGEEILLEQIRERGDSDSYPYSALITHKLRYLKKFQLSNMGEQLEDLKNLAQLGLQRHPLDEAMKDAHDEVLREYMMQAVPRRYQEASSGAYDVREDVN